MEITEIYPKSNHSIQKKSQNFCRISTASSLTMTMTQFNSENSGRCTQFWITIIVLIQQTKINTVLTNPLMQFNRWGPNTWQLFFLSVMKYSKAIFFSEMVNFSTKLKYSFKVPLYPVQNFSLLQKLLCYLYFWMFQQLKTNILALFQGTSHHPSPSGCWENKKKWIKGSKTRGQIK